jgi:hypothetical protein
MQNLFSFVSRLFRFYHEGFKNMSLWGRRVWLIIIIKLFIIFAILKIFFFQDFLKRKYDNENQRSDYVIEQLINSPDNHD